MRFCFDPDLPMVAMECMDCSRPMAQLSPEPESTRTWYCLACGAVQMQIHPRFVLAAFTDEVKPLFPEDN